ncbi:uncharacterized protein [Heptranchias perlo]|uniref:uncharacterized protein n=1 Tax=Heptranchias perlo TaxID=212740 RepID=UPI00355985D8
MPIVLCVLLLTEAVVVDAIKNGQGECTEVNFDGSSRVLLRCSDPSYARALLVQWRWTGLPQKNRRELILVQIGNGNITKQPDRADMRLSTKACIENGNCSMTLTPRASDAGTYHCMVWTNHRITEEKTRLVYRANFTTIYIAAGVCGGLLLIAIGIIWIVFKRKAGCQARSSESQIHQENSLNLNSTYMNLNLAEQEVYCNLKR